VLDCMATRIGNTCVLPCIFFTFKRRVWTGKVYGLCGRHKGEKCLVFIVFSLWTLLMSYMPCHLYPFRNILWVASFLSGLCMIYFAICHSYILLLSSLFTKLRTVTISRAMSVGLSVCLLIFLSASFGSQGMDFCVLRTSIIICWEIIATIKIRQKKKKALYTKKLVHL